jgi:hypothetical protein
VLGHGTRFEQKMEQAIAALLSHRNVEDAARAVGVSVNTLRRWMQVPGFQAACREARRKILSQAIGQLRNAAGAAAKTVLKIMVDPTVPAGIRLRAAEVVLDQAVKAGKMEEIADRLAKLERIAGLGRTSPERSADLTLLSATPLPAEAAARPQIASTRLDAAETDEDVDK